MAVAAAEIGEAGDGGTLPALLAGIAVVEHEGEARVAEVLFA